MTVDTGFGDVLAGEVYVHPEPDITVTVKEEPPCPPSTTSAPEPSSPSSPLSLPITAPSPTSTSEKPSTGSAPSLLTAAGVQAAKTLVSLPPMEWPALSKLARDVAMDIKERHTILAEHKLTQVQYDFLEANNDFYRNALAEACRQWHAPLSTQERIKVEAAAILEDSLLGIGARMQNRAEGLPGVIEAAKLFAKIADVGEQRGVGISSGERFVINIDLGGDQKISVGVGGDADALPAHNQLRALPPNGEVS